MENKTASDYNDLPLKAPKLKGILLILFLPLSDPKGVVETEKS